MVSMGATVQSFRSQAETQARELIRAIETAERVIVETIDRECEALRAGRHLAADALRLRLRDAASLYLNLVRAARASIWTIEQVVPGSRAELEARRVAFSALLKVELAILAAERAAAGSAPRFARAPDVRVPADVVPLAAARQPAGRRPAQPRRRA